MGGRQRKRDRVSKQPAPFKRPDPRVTYAHAQGDQNVQGLQIPDGALILATGSVKLNDARLLLYPGPNVARFNLLEARAHQKRAEKLRTELLASLRALSDGSFQVTDMRRLFDFLSAATSSVLMSIAAIEGVANALIDNLPEGTSITIDRRGVPEIIGKGDMARRMAIAEKLDLVVPLTGQPSPKGTAVWERFVHLRRLRDDLVHIKEFGYSAEPTEPQAYGQLLRGDGNTAVQDAALLISAAAPGWVEEVSQELGI
jgi:hypothetical protein